ncbi:MAG: GH25 family lysozyme [Phyllobacterium sp.]|uniref:glycoside hydrolase family 25 protein n=1 Tax=Phyllobacterium sp. TaxID=1871046 RepID=UPI0030F0649B
MTIRVPRFAIAVALAALFLGDLAQAASEFTTPWSNKQRAIVLDGYEHNSFNLVEIAKDSRIAAFIHKGSDGLPANYQCKRITDVMQQELCKRIWRNYAVSRELYQTRRILAKALGLKWGAYHLARPGNPIEQANHFVDYAEPSDDELVAIDIEDNDPAKFMSLQDAEIFAEHIKFRIGRYPVLYTNGTTARYIADHRLEFPILSRLQLWYARYESDIAPHFPKGNWRDYALWQFTSQSNCSKQKCPYRPAGTNRDIDVNITDMTVAQLRRAWPLGQLVDAIPLDDLPTPGNRPSPPEDILMAAAQPPLLDYRHLKEMAGALRTVAANFVVGASALLEKNDPSAAKVDQSMTASISLKHDTDERLTGLSIRKATIETLLTSLREPSRLAPAYPGIAVTSYCFRYAAPLSDQTTNWQLAALGPLL